MNWMMNWSEFFFAIFLFITLLIIEMTIVKCFVHGERDEIPIILLYEYIIK